jgi:hypothetical protein
MGRDGCTHLPPASGTRRGSAHRLTGGPSLLGQPKLGVPGTAPTTAPRCCASPRSRRGPHGGRLVQAVPGGRGHPGRRPGLHRARPRPRRRRRTGGGTGGWMVVVCRRCCVIVRAGRTARPRLWRPSFRSGCMTVAAGRLGTTLGRRCDRGCALDRGEGAGIRRRLPIVSRPYAALPGLPRPLARFVATGKGQV